MTRHDISSCFQPTQALCQSLENEKADSATGLSTSPYSGSSVLASVSRRFHTQPKSIKFLALPIGYAQSPQVTLPVQSRAFSKSSIDIIFAFKFTFCAAMHIESWHIRNSQTVLRVPWPNSRTVSTQALPGSFQSVHWKMFEHWQTRFNMSRVHKEYSAICNGSSPLLRQ